MMPVPSGFGNSSSVLRSDNGMSLKLHDLPIFGRDAQLETINTLYNEGESRATIVAIHGKAGSGKSTLIQSHQQTWSSNGCLFAYGRFDKTRSEPFSGIIDALRDLVNKWASTDEGIKEIQGFAPKATLDEEVLCASVPQLSEIYNEGTGQNKKSKETATDKPSGSTDFKFGDIRRAAYQLLSFLCAKSRRVVLFLDDIEWADTVSCDFLDLMSKDNTGFEGLLIAVSYEDETLSKEHPVGKTLSHFEESTWHFNKIHIPDLDLNAVNQIVSTVTKIDPEQTIPLSEVVLKKAGGNSFFVLQFLRLLEEEEFLTYSFISLKWEWGDVTTIERTMNVSDDVADIVALSMRRLESETLQILMIASCFGTEIPLKVFTEYMRGIQSATPPNYGNEEGQDCKEEPSDDPLLTFSVDCSRLKEILDSIVRAGILGQRQTSEQYLWLHDKLQRAAYSMISESTRCTIHSRLGYCLCSMISSIDSEGWMIYIAADQFNKSFILKHETSYCIEVADLNLKAAKLSISRSAFYPAIELLRAGLKQLNEKTCWKDNYDLTLDIYSTLAETDFLIGNHDKAMITVNEVLANVQRREDKFRVQHVQMQNIDAGVSRDYSAAVQVALDILDDYGLRLPRKPNKAHQFLANRRLRSLLPDGKIDSFQGLPSAADDTAIRMGKLLTFVGFHNIYNPGGSRLVWLSSLHSLELSFEYGVNGSTARSLIHLGNLLKHQGRVHEACTYLQSAIKLCDRFDSIPDETRFYVKATAYAVILPTVRPFHECLDELLIASQMGFRLGETEFAALVGFTYCLTYFCVGLPLAPVESDLISFCKDIRQLGVAYAVQALFQILQQTIMNLEGKSDSLTELKGDTMDQDEMLSRLEGHGHSTTLRDIHTFRLILACIFRDLDTAESLVEALGRAPDTDQMFCRVHIRTVFMGLASMALGKKRGIKKYLSQGKKILKQIRSQVKKGSTNAHPILLMLEAEEDPSKSRFDTAIAACARSGLMHYQAYMCESAGLYFLELDDKGWGEFYLRRALELYHDWGASKKVNVMKAENEFLRTSQQSITPSSSLKGRSRYENIVKGALGSFQRFNISG